VSAGACSSAYHRRGYARALPFPPNTRYAALFQRLAEAARAGRVETYREGAEGERQAEKALRPLEPEGWCAFHDIQTGYGNYDL
jgi:hypothetical protein